jgi:hypothetical protein
MSVDPYAASIASNGATAPSATAASFSTNGGWDTDRRESDMVVAIPHSSVYFDHMVAAAALGTASVASSLPPTGTISGISTHEATLAFALPFESGIDSMERSAEEGPRTFKGRVVKAKNAHLPDEVLAFRERRQRRTKVATWTAGVVGLVTTGPLGAVVCGAGAYAAAKGVGKRRERALLSKCAGAAPYAMADGAVYPPPQVTASTAHPFLHPTEVV